MNYSDTEFIADEPLSQENEIESRDSSVLVPEANVHIDPSNEEPEDPLSATEDHADEHFEISTVYSVQVITLDESKGHSGSGIQGTAKESTSKKRQCSKTGTKETEINSNKGKKKKMAGENPFKWTKKAGKQQQGDICSLEQEVKLDLPEYVTPFVIFQETIQLDELVAILVEQTNLYARQNGRQFETNSDEIKAFLGINFVMSINKLPNLKSYWQIDEYVGNEGIRNVVTRKRFQGILRNLHFADNEVDDKSDRGYKIRPIINHLNTAFRSAVSDGKSQAIDEHMTKFKGKHSARQYLKNKPIKWGFKW